MNRRYFLVGSTTAASVFSAGQAFADARETADMVVIIFADACPICQEFIRWDLAKYISAAGAKRKTVRHFSVARGDNLKELARWPSDLRYVYDQLTETSGTPRFIYLRNRRIVHIDRFGPAKTFMNI